MRDRAALPFTKMQAVGNDFVVVEAARWPGTTDWSQQAIRLCDRRFGMGADGLMVWGPSDKADLQARMWNPDGTEDMCGNGTRCVLHLALDGGAIPTTGTIATLSGIRSYGANEDSTITVEMGVPKFSPEDIPMTRPDIYSLNIRVAPGVGVTKEAVNTGSTHLVCFLWPEQIADMSWEDGDWFHQVSPELENLRRFPERTSVMWTYPEDDHTLRLRIWERGVGETLGCGTGACAAVVCARQASLLLAGDVTVHSKGGTLRVGWTRGENNPMYLTGTAHVIYSGVVHGEG